MRSPFWGTRSVVLLVAAYALPAIGQHAAHAPAASDTLRLDAVLAALDASPELRASRLGADARAAAAEAAGAWPDPTAGVTVQPFPLVTARGAQRSAWRVEQPIHWPGTRRLRRASAGFGAEIAAAESDVLAADLALEAQEAYIQLARVQASERLIRQYQQRLGAFAEAAAVRYEVGRGPQASILRAQLEGGRLDSRLFALEANRHLALSMLARLLDRPDLRVGSVVVEEPALPETDSLLLTLARRQRAEYDALAAAEAQAQTDIALAQKAFYPELGVGVTYYDIADRDVPMTADGADALALSVSVRVPLDRSSRRARLAASRLRAEQIGARQDALDTAVQTHIDGHLAHARHERDALLLLRNRLIPQAQTTVASTQSAYTVGQVDFLDLLDAERALFELRLAEADAQARFLIAAAQLARALGLPSFSALSALAGASDD